MKILREYVWDAIRKNKRTSLAIMTALFLMTTMMSLLLRVCLYDVDGFDCAFHQ